MQTNEKVPREVIGKWRFPSLSGDVMHVVTQWRDGSLSCDCPGWTFKRPGRERDCRHVRVVAGRLKDAEAVVPAQGQPIVSPAPVKRQKARFVPPGPQMVLSDKQAAEWLSKIRKTPRDLGRAFTELQLEVEKRARKPGAGRGKPEQPSMPPLAEPRRRAIRLDEEEG